MPVLNKYKNNAGKELVPTVEEANQSIVQIVSSSHKPNQQIDAYCPTAGRAEIN